MIDSQRTLHGIPAAGGHPTLPSQEISVMRVTLPLTALALSASVAAHAATIIYTNPSDTVVQSVNGLLVDGTTYNVTFSTVGTSTFQSNLSGATDAANALDAALNTSTAAFVQLAGGGTDANFDVLWFGNIGIDSTSSQRVGFWTVFGLQTDLSNADFTKVTPVAVTPEPSSLILLGTCVLGVIGAARRRFA